MARRPKPWLRKGRGWFVTVDGKQVSLGKNKNLAHERFHELMAQPKPASVRGSSPLVAEVLDSFLEWTRRHRAEKTFESYRERLQWFLDAIPAEISTSQLKPHHAQTWFDDNPNWSASTNGAWRSQHKET